MDIKSEQVKNGNSVLIITTKIDTSNPKCWIDGNFYKFNSEIINVEVLYENKSRICK